METIHYTLIKDCSSYVFTRRSLLLCEVDTPHLPFLLCLDCTPTIRNISDLFFEIGVSFSSFLRDSSPNLCKNLCKNKIDRKTLYGKILNRIKILFTRKNVRSF